jgi:hypothetical protein
VKKNLERNNVRLVSFDQLSSAFDLCNWSLDNYIFIFYILYNNSKLIISILKINSLLCTYILLIKVYKMINLLSKIFIHLNKFIWTKSIELNFRIRAILLNQENFFLNFLYEKYIIFFTFKYLRRI